MDPKEEGRILGKLEEGFKGLDIRLTSIELKVDNLDKFKIKVTAIMGTIVALIEGVRWYFDGKSN